MKHLTLPRLLLVYVLSLIIVAYMYANIENRTFFDGFYWASVTATTIGYGDLLPTQTSTRIIMIIFSHFQVFFCIPCVVVLLMSKVIHDENRFTHNEQEWMENVLQAISKKVGVEVPNAPDGEE